MPYGNSPKTKAAWREATAKTEEMGFKSFKKGSPGQAKRGQIAEGIAAKPKKSTKKAR